MIKICLQFTERYLSLNCHDGCLSNFQLKVIFCFKQFPNSLFLSLLRGSCYFNY